MYDLQTTTQTEDPKEKPSWDCKGVSDYFLNQMLQLRRKRDLRSS